MFNEKEVTISFKLNRHLLIGLVLGLVIGSTGTVVGAKAIGKIRGNANAQGGTRTFTTTTTAPQAQPSAPAPAQQITVTDDDHIRGNKNAPVVLVEFSDFQCPYCARHHSAMQNIMSRYGDKVAWVYRHFPLSFHEQAMPAAMAAECAAEQGKFWEYADLVFSRQNELASGGQNFFEGLATSLGLNMNQFRSCVQSQKYSTKVNANMQEGQANSVEGTPATFVNGTLVSGAVPEAELTRLIDQQLQK